MPIFMCVHVITSSFGTLEEKFSSQLNSDGSLQNVLTDNIILSTDCSCQDAIQIDIYQVVKT